MARIEQSADKLEFISSLSPTARLFFLLCGLFPWLAPYELLLKPNWNGRFSLVMLFFLAISIGAVSVSFFFIAAALWGRSQHFRFEASSRRLSYRFKTAFGPVREERYDFSQIEALEIKVSEWESRADTYDLSLKVRAKPDMTFGDFASRSDAEHYRSVLKNMIGL